MEIAPIAGIRAMPVVRPQPVDPDLSAVYDIDNSARAEDETWTPSNGDTGRGAEEDDPEEDPVTLQMDEAGETEDAAAAPVSDSLEAPQINLFA